MKSYSVALWRWWPTSSFPYVAEDRHALSPLLAALDFMHACHLKEVAYAAVSCDGVVTRWETGLRLVADEAPERESEEGDVYAD